MKNYFDPERGATLENLRQKNDKLRVGGHLDHVVHANPASVCICIHTPHTHTCIHTQRHTHEGSGEIFELVKCLPSKYKDLSLVSRTYGKARHGDLRLQSQH